MRDDLKKRPGPAWFYVVDNRKYKKAAEKLKDNAVVRLIASIHKAARTHLRHVLRYLELVANGAGGLRQITIFDSVWFLSHHEQCGLPVQP